jgi:hypothetical protein
MKFIHLLIISLFISSTLSIQSCDGTEKKEFPTYGDEEVLDMVQKDALRYFWEYAESNSKLARERYHTDDPSNDAHVVATGGSGFGLMTLLTGIERGFIPRNEAVSRMTTSLNFLKTADRFHGAWSHWIDGTTGEVIPFGSVDNGGDLVETSFLCAGLLCVREYFKDGNEAEQALAQLADTLWRGVEWDWYTKGENALYWHWSPEYEWQINFKLEGYNECLITYILGASSPTHPIPAEAYHEGWARNGAIVSSKTSFNLPIIFNHNGCNTVGPLFWSHYTWLGINPFALSDQYADYRELNINHSKIVYQYCVTNPLGWTGYSDSCWGLTASYSRNANGTIGYTDHKPENDRGVISPTAALSSFPYTPEESMRFLKFLYERNADQLIGPAGPYDAFAPHYNWVAKRYLAIDQGTIAPMIENYRSGMIWDLLMNAPEVKLGLQTLSFSVVE